MLWVLTACLFQGEVDDKLGGGDVAIEDTSVEDTGGDDGGDGDDGGGGSGDGGAGDGGAGDGGAGDGGAGDGGGDGTVADDVDDDGWTVADGDCDDEDDAVNPGVAFDACD